MAQAISTEQERAILKYYPLYGCVFATELSGVSRRVVIQYAKKHGLSNPDRETVNQRIIALIKSQN